MESLRYRTRPECRCYGVPITGPPAAFTIRPPPCSQTRPRQCQTATSAESSHMREPPDRPRDCISSWKCGDSCTGPTHAPGCCLPEPADYTATRECLETLASQLRNSRLNGSHLWW